VAEVAWSLRARDDLRDIHDYIARDSSAAAAAMVDRLIGATERLDEFPESGRVLPEFPDSGYREILVGNYRVLYRAEASRVVVLAIVHGRRLLDRAP